MTLSSGGSAGGNSGDVSVMSGMSDLMSSGSVLLSSSSGGVSGVSGDVSVRTGVSSGVGGSGSLMLGSGVSMSGEGGDVSVLVGDSSVGDGGSVYVGGGVSMSGVRRWCECGGWFGVGCWRFFVFVRRSRIGEYRRQCVIT